MFVVTTQLAAGTFDHGIMQSLKRDRVPSDKETDEPARRSYLRRCRGQRPSERDRVATARGYYFDPPATVDLVSFEGVRHPL